jgi:hypothetical protein
LREISKACCRFSSDALIREPIETKSKSMGEDSRYRYGGCGIVGVVVVVVVEKECTGDDDEEINNSPARAGTTARFLTANKAPLDGFHEVLAKRTNIHWDGRQWLE